MPRGTSSWTSNFDRFLIGFCCQLGPPEPHFSSPRCRESTIEQKIAFRNRHRFLIDFGANLPPFSLQKSSKIASKTDLETHRFFDRFWHRFFLRFGSILGPNLGPCWGHVGSENRPRAAQDAFQAPIWLQNGAPDPSKWCPRPFILDRFWCYFLWFLEDLFTALFSSTWDHIDVDFRSSAVAGTQLCCALDINIKAKISQNTRKRILLEVAKIENFD